MTDEEFSIVIDVHLKGTFYVCHPAFKLMKENSYGRIVNIASPSGLFGNFGQANYGAAKMGIVGLTNILAIEGAKYNIKANVIAFYFISFVFLNFDQVEKDRIIFDHYIYQLIH